jgi:uncharacterized membrane protein YdbT with pleckstrin-like domain
MDLNEIADFLKHVYIFRGLEDKDYVRIARQVEIETRPDGVTLFSQGDEATDFFIIYSGEIRLEREHGRGVPEEIGVLDSRDFFGEQGLMTQNPRSASAITIGETVLFKLDQEVFNWLLEEYKQIMPRLQSVLRSYQMARRRKMNWLDNDEIIHMVCRKHIYLLVPWIGFSGILTLVAFSLYRTGNFILQYGAGVLFVFAVLWFLWKWVDWGNDYYIVTDRRVVWLERVILLYDSRQEAPLEEILSVNSTTSQIQRIFGSADVVVRTLTGSIVMRNVDLPKQLITTIEEYWQRSKIRFERTQTAAMREAIRERLGFASQQPGDEPEAPTSEVDDESEADAEQAEQPSQPGLLESIFKNFLKTRFEVDGVVTYRKHWFLLFRKIWLLIFFLLLAIMLISLHFLGFLESVSISTIVLGAVIVSIGLSPWWLYQYADWRNDIYQVTDKHILDIERKPLGREVKKSAPLENILNMSLEQSLLQRIFNFGTVVINVGEATFNFIGVQNPGEVQLELFQHYHARKRALELDEAARERERIVEWLSMYHGEVENYHRNQNEFDTNQESR